MCSLIVRIELVYYRLVKDASALTVRDVVVLSILAEAPTYGYAMEAELQRRDVRDWADISRPQVYKSLEKLQRLGYAVRSASAETSRGPDSATVRITRTGRLALNRRLADDDWVQRRDRPLFLTWLALCSTLPTASIVAGIDARTKFLVAQRERERRTLGSIERDVTVTSCFPKAMVDLAIRQFDVELLWLADLRVAVAGASR